MLRSGRARRPHAEMASEQVLALLEEETRPHDDLDLMARLEDIDPIRDAPGGAGCELAGGGPTTGYALDEEHQLDVRMLGRRLAIPVPEFRAAS